MDKQKLIIASTNLHKIRELKGMLKGLPFDLYSLRDFPEYQAPEETGATFEENAKLKAENASTLLGGLVIADDSGLVVPALGGKPGVYSARYAGEGATDKENCDKLISKLTSIEEKERNGYYECCLALARDGKTEKVVSGYAEGTLLTEMRGRSGFGYDPLFIKYDYSKTFAELDEEVKNRISHRRKALDKMVTYIEGNVCATS